MGLLLLVYLPSKQKVQELTPSRDLVSVPPLNFSCLVCRWSNLTLLSQADC